MLYLIATPIGNLGDITSRAIETLKNCTLILCEDTKVSLKLIRHFTIDTPLESYHKFSEKEKLQRILTQLEMGENIALISDAGTPAICDPGALLVNACHQKNIPITSIPGACALSVAMSLSGNSNIAIQFMGFVPKKGKEKKDFLIKMASFDGNSFAYDTPHQITKTLHILDPLGVNVTIFRELTKMHEQIAFGKPLDVLQKLTLKGEFVLLVEGQPQIQKQIECQTLFKKLTHEYKLSPTIAVKLMADLLGINKKSLYQEFVIGNSPDHIDA